MSGIPLTSPNELSGAVYALQNPQATVLYTAAPTALSTLTTIQYVGLAAYFSTSHLTRVRAVITGSISGSTANKITSTTYYGTGTAPVNAATTGTGSTTTSALSFFNPVAADELTATPFTIYAVVTGLTVGTTYWFDIGATAAGSTTATYTGVQVVIEEF